jgi:energy-coupling factor transporter ATP-binding protein EcfA2
MNGAILGLTHDEMAERFDDIAAFADIGEFIDQPVKLYSSGMLLRLAFAVQVHVDADILIVDEALSVGDVFFQAKCSRALQKFRDKGGTLLFVSHDTFAVERLCTHGLVLDHGDAAFWGDVAQAVHVYYYLERNIKSQGQTGIVNAAPVHLSDTANDMLGALAALEAVPVRRQSATSNGSAYIETIYITDEAGKSTTQFAINQWMHIYAVVRFDQDAADVDFGAGLSDRSAVLLGGAHSWYLPTKDKSVNVKAGERWVFHTKLRLSVAAGEYLLLIGLAKNFSMSIWEDMYVLLDACTIHVSGMPQFWGQHEMDAVIFDPERVG